MVPLSTVRTHALEAPDSCDGEAGDGDPGLGGGRLSAAELLIAAFRQTRVYRESPAEERERLERYLRDLHLAAPPR